MSAQKLFVEQNDTRICSRGTEHLFCVCRYKSKGSDKITEIVAENMEEQDAKLFAAAPDLLSALEKIAVGLSPNSVAMQHDNIAVLLHECAEIAQDAIRKAKGETL